MRKIAVINLKGGTGKTTSVVNIGAGLAICGKRVLLVDVDAQGGVALSLGLSYSYSLADALTGTVPIQKCVLTARDRLAVIASDESLLPAQRAVSRHADYTRVLSRLLQPLEADYDFIILDCAASINLLNVNALVYANETFIPTQVEFLSLAGLERVLENLARVRFPKQPRGTASDLGVPLIIPTMFDARRRQSHLLLAELRRTYGRHVTDPIRINVRLSEASARRQTIFEYAPASTGASDYGRLVGLILKEPLLAEEPIGLQRPFQPARPEPVSAPVEGPPPPAKTAPEEAPLEAAGPEEEAAEEIALTLAGPLEAAAGETPPAPAGPLEAAAGETPLPPAGPEEETPKEVPAAPVVRHFAAGTAHPTSALCPNCKIPLTSISAAGYRIYQCDRCGYQKQVLLRDLHAR